MAWFLEEGIDDEVEDSLALYLVLVEMFYLAVLGPHLEPGGSVEGSVTVVLEADGVHVGPNHHLGALVGIPRGYHETQCPVDYVVEVSSSHILDRHSDLYDRVKGVFPLGHALVDRKAQGLGLRWSDCSERTDHVDHTRKDCTSVRRFMAVGPGRQLPHLFWSDTGSFNQFGNLRVSRKVSDFLGLL